MSAGEAVWRIYGYDCHEQYPATTRLPIHLENQQKLIFNKNTNLQELIDNKKETRLTSFFELNKTNDLVKTLYYHQMEVHIPEINRLFHLLHLTSENEGICFTIY